MFGFNVLDSALNIDIPFGKDNAIISEAERMQPCVKYVISPFHL